MTEQAALESLREAGAARLDPVRFHYLEQLAERLQSAPIAVRERLRGTLQQGLADCAERVQQAQPLPGDDVGDEGQVTAALELPDTLLAELNRYIESVTGNGAQSDERGSLSGARESWPGLKSAERFEEAWSRICAQDAVDRAIDRGPENAGPLNSHKLVLRSLELMRELSPDYLRRFLAHAESLLWLDQAYGKLRQPAVVPRPKAARQGRSRK